MWYFGFTTLLYFKENKNDVAKALFEYGAKIDVDYVEERLIISGITEYSQRYGGNTLTVRIYIDKKQDVTINCLQLS